MTQNKEADIKWRQRKFILLVVTFWTCASPSEKFVLLAKAVSKYLL
jgi:hypothetical protein